MAIELPSSIDRYIDIANSGGDLEATAQCFAPEVVVRDEGQTYRGLAAVQSWMAETKRKYGHTIEPLTLAKRDGTSLLTARLIGNFPGSPITLTFSFVLDGQGRITSVKVGS